MDFVDSLILVSEKAARIARIIREKDHLLSLLTQEKEGEFKNARFERDFKTLTDVLVQEVIKHDLCKTYPELEYSIYGEETIEFVLASGEVVSPTVKSTVEETKAFLADIFEDDVAAELLAEVVHKQITFDDLPINTVISKDSHPYMPKNVAVWIDPIDSTAEYINAADRYVDEYLVGGLNCVTVLIGAYNKSTGIPVAGVINQPFYKNEDGTLGRILWGTSFLKMTRSSVSPVKTEPKKVLMISGTETQQVREMFEELGYKLIEASGAGYKLLCVIEGKVDGYILSKPTTFFWDTCACDAVLRSMGGGILDFRKATYDENVDDAVIRYYNAGSFCNEGGLIAYANKSIRDNLIEIAKDGFQ